MLEFGRLNLEVRNKIHYNPHAPISVWFPVQHTVADIRICAILICSILCVKYKCCEWWFFYKLLHVISKSLNISLNTSYRYWDASIYLHYLHARFLFSKWAAVDWHRNGDLVTSARRRQDGTVGCLGWQGPAICLQATIVPSHMGSYLAVLLLALTCPSRRDLLTAPETPT